MVRGMRSLMPALILWGCGGLGSGTDPGGDAIDAGDDPGIEDETSGTAGEVSDAPVDREIGEIDEEDPVQPDPFPDLADTGVSAWTPPFDPTACGAEPHAWIPPAQVRCWLRCDPGTGSPRI